MKTDDTGPYPKILYRWIGEILPPGEAYTPASLTAFAVGKGILRREHAPMVRLFLERLIIRKNMPAEARFERRGKSTEAWFSETWQRLLYAQAPQAPKRLRFQFLIERALDGELHHASSLAWLITETEAWRVGAPNLASGRHMAYQSLSKLRRRRIRIEPDGKRRGRSDRLNLSKPYPAWDARVWKSAFGVPGYYGLHLPPIEDELETGESP